MKYIICNLLFFSTISWSKEFNYELQKNKTSVEFEAKASPSVLSIKGQKAQGKGLLKILDGHLSGNISVELNDFDTDIDSRNEHMKEKYLETGKPGFNISKLILTAIPINKDFPEIIKKIETQNIEGLLTLHGVEKKIKAQLNLNSTILDEISGTINFKIKLTDFGVEVPSFAGITLADEIAIKSDYVAKMAQVIKQ